MTPSSPIILYDYSQAAVTVDDDPGRNLGAPRQPGHRFLFRPEEVEPLAEGSNAT
jgi:hypothetical protein